MDACINKGAEQLQETERTSDVLTDFNLKSEIFFTDFFVLEVK